MNCSHMAHCFGIWFGTPERRLSEVSAALGAEGYFRKPYSLWEMGESGISTDWGAILPERLRSSGVGQLAMDDTDAEINVRPSKIHW